MEAASGVGVACFGASVGGVAPAGATGSFEPAPTLGRSTCTGDFFNEAVGPTVGVVAAGFGVVGCGVVRCGEEDSPALCMPAGRETETFGFFTSGAAALCVGVGAGDAGLFAAGACGIDPCGVFDCGDGAPGDCVFGGCVFGS